MERNEMLKELFVSDEFKVQAANITTLDELQQLFSDNGVSMTHDEVFDLCSQIAHQVEHSADVDLTEDSLESVTGGVAWALVGLGAMCIGALAVGIYNGYQSTKRKEKNG